jgi:hypothetical protein
VQHLSELARKLRENIVELAGCYATPQHARGSLNGLSGALGIELGSLGEG